MIARASDRATPPVARIGRKLLDIARDRGVPREALEEALADGTVLRTVEHVGKPQGTTRVVFVNGLAESCYDREERARHDARRRELIAKGLHAEALAAHTLGAEAAGTLHGAERLVERGPVAAAVAITALLAGSLGAFGGIVATLLLT